MIVFKEDRSYLRDIDLVAIEQGVAELGVHSLKIDRHYTEEQKQENSRIYDSITKEQWNERCEIIRHQLAEKIEGIVDAIHAKFTIYQYKNKDVDYSKDDWDLFFWCNGGDMSYVTLNPNKKRSIEQQKETVDAVLEVLKEIEVDGIQVTIQYTAIYNEDKVKDIVSNYCEEMKGQFINYGGHIGKIVKTEEGFFFRKKGAKKYQYYINNETILRNVLMA